MKFRITSLLTGALAVLATMGTLLADTYTVTNTNDTLTAGTLRQAITDANAHANSLNPGSVPDRIEFAIPGAGVKTISPASALPTITDPVVIDGYTQSGAAQNTDPGGFNGTLLIELNGTNAGTGISALTITGGNSTIQGMVINGFDGVGINLNSANNLVEGNFVGTNAAGSAALANNSQGIRVDSAAGNIIGGTAAEARNVISGNGEGFEIRGTGADNTSVLGNLVGTNAAGTGALGNLSNGIRITNGPTGTIVGGTASGARNVISANQQVGVIITNSNVTGSFVQGNYIGTDVTGTVGLGNVEDGIRINAGTSSNTVGGTAAGAGNLISGNGGDGVVISDSGTVTNVVQGNFIGTDVTGTTGLGNTFNGVRINGAPNNTIGGTAAGAGNIISGNNENGASIIGTSATTNLVQGNFIGTDVSGTAALGNTNVGIYIFGAPNNTIGGTASGARNIISGNSLQGVVIDTSDSSGNQVEGNYIGTDVTGTTGLGNTLAGVFIQGAPSNTIGGNAVGAGNVISGNGTDGVSVTGATAQSNQISGNLIGRNAANDGPLGNTGHGVFLMSSGPNIVGGGFNPNNANTIWNNGRAGVAIVFGTGPCIKKGIISNSIFANGGLGIDLEDDGVTPNDLGDGDTGANTLQNFPVLTSASTGGGNTTIDGSLNSTANTSFHIEFFSSEAADPSEYGEGQTFLGFKDVTTDNNGNVTFTAVLPVLPPAGQTIISSTTSDNVELANTSEFSKVVQLAGTAGQLQNISTRLRVLTGDNVLIGGLIITGVDPKKVMFRAIGPSLAVNNVPVQGRLDDPTLTLYDSDGVVVEFNDNWGDAPEPERTDIENSGLKPDNVLESAILRTLNPGAYTAIVRGKNDTTGIALVEAYDLSPASNSRLANLSTRGFVDTGDNAMIGGTIVGGGGGGSVRVIVRGIGPSLNVNGVPVPGRMADPTLQLVDENGDVLIENDNWKTAQQTEIEATGLAPSDDLESAIVTILPPGGRGTTAILRGKNDTTGVALVEIYELPGF